MNLYNSFFFLERYFFFLHLLKMQYHYSHSHVFDCLHFLNNLLAYNSIPLLLSPFPSQSRLSSIAFFFSFFLLNHIVVVLQGHNQLFPMQHRRLTGWATTAILLHPLPTSTSTATIITVVISNNNSCCCRSKAQCFFRSHYPTSSTLATCFPSLPSSVAVCSYHAS